MSGLALRCMESWRRHLPDYELRLWNEDCFDVAQVRYVKQAYEARKFAFVTDYVRLYALYHCGGIYMDTDVEVVRNLDHFLQHGAFSGFESTRDVPTGLIGAEAGHALIGILLRQYDHRCFTRKDGSCDMTSNVVIVTTYLASRGLVRKNMFQCIEGLHLYPQHVFCAKCRLTHELEVTSETCAIHHFAGSWYEAPARVKVFKWLFEKPITLLFGKRAYVRCFELAKRVHNSLRMR